MYPGTDGESKVNQIAQVTGHAPLVIANRTFEEWVELLKRDPAAFESERLRCLAEAVVEGSRGDTGRAQRMASMLWRREQALRHYGNGVARYNKVVSLFFQEDIWPLADLRGISGSQEQPSLIAITKDSDESV